VEKSDENSGSAREKDKGAKRKRTGGSSFGEPKDRGEQQGRPMTKTKVGSWRGGLVALGQNRGGKKG